MTSEQARRYARQVRLPEVGPAGQARLLKAGVLIVGLGGLGSPAALYLAAAGVGRLGLLDGDRVSLANLQRQILYTTADVGRSKAEAAAERLAALNPGCRLEPRPEMLDDTNARACVAAYDAVVDGTDSFEAKFRIAAACHAAGIPYAHGGVQGFTGQAMTVQPGRTACCRCLFDRPLAAMPRPPRGGPRGPLGPVPGMIGAVQAAEIIRLLAGIGRLLTNRLLVADALAMDVRTVPVRRNPDCPLCGRASGTNQYPRPYRCRSAKRRKDRS